MNTRELIKQELEWASGLMPYQPKEWVLNPPGGPKKLEQDDIPMIWELMIDLSVREIATKFGVCKATITNIYRGKCWQQYQPSVGLRDRVAGARKIRVN